MPPKAASKLPARRDSLKSMKALPGQPKAPTVSNGSRSELENYFDRLRALDKADSGTDAMGASGIQQLCSDLGVTVDSLEMLVLMWKVGAIRQSSITRPEWLTSMYLSGIEQLPQLRTQLGEWVKEVSKKGEFFTEMYNFIYDYIRGERDRQMPAQAAARAWEVLLKDEKIIRSWNKWVLEEYKREVSRDLWRQVWCFVSTVKDVNDFDSNGRWPTAIDDYVEWAKKAPRPAQAS